MKHTVEEKKEYGQMRIRGKKQDNLDASLFWNGSTVMIDFSA